MSIKWFVESENEKTLFNFAIFLLTLYSNKIIIPTFSSEIHFDNNFSLYDVVDVKPKSFNLINVCIMIKNGI